MLTAPHGRIAGAQLLRHLPLLVAVIPLIAMFGALAIGVLAESLPPCFPPLDGCASISATGRKPPGSFLFRILMLPQAVLLALLWLLVAQWLNAIGKGHAKAYPRGILVAGLIGAVALAVYVTFLGTREPIYELMRRYGIYLGFLGIAIAQFLLALALRRIGPVVDDKGLIDIGRRMLWVSGAVLAAGLLNLVLKATLSDPDAAENIIEWWVSLVMQANFWLLYRAWRSTDTQVRLQVR